MGSKKVWLSPQQGTKLCMLIQMKSTVTKQKPFDLQAKEITIQGVVDVTAACAVVNLLQNWLMCKGKYMFKYLNLAITQLVDSCMSGTTAIPRVQFSLLGHSIHGQVQIFAGVMHYIFMAFVILMNITMM